MRRMCLFLELASRIGLRFNELFSPPDLVFLGDVSRVITCLHKLFGLICYKQQVYSTYATPVPVDTTINLSSQGNSIVPSYMHKSIEQKELQRKSVIDVLEEEKRLVRTRSSMAAEAERNPRPRIAMNTVPLPIYRPTVVDPHKNRAHAFKFTGTEPTNLEGGDGDGSDESDADSMMASDYEGPTIKIEDVSRDDNLLSPFKRAGTVRG